MCPNTLEREKTFQTFKQEGMKMIEQMAVPLPIGPIGESCSLNDSPSFPVLFWLSTKNSIL
jgi:hypothetical protein